MRHKQIINLVLCALLLFTSCSEDSPVTTPGEAPNQGTLANNPGDIRLEIGFHKGEAETRVSTWYDFSTWWVDGDQIGLFAVRRPKDGTGQLAATGNYIHNVKLTYKGIWQLDPGVELWYPSGNDDVLDFYAYYPYDDNGGNPEGLNPSDISFKVKTDQSGQFTAGDGSQNPNYNLSDLLAVADNNSGKGYGRAEAATPVTLSFSHALTMVQVEVVGKGIDPWQLSVKLKGISPGVTLNLGATGGPATEPATEDNAPVDINMNWSSGYTFRAIVPSQTIAEGKQFISVVYKGEAYNGTRIPAGGLALEAGEVKKFKRSITQGGIYSPTELVNFAKEYNAAENDIPARNAVLAKWSDDGTATGVIRLWADMDMTGVTGFEPIGNTSMGGPIPFTGKFDGQGYTITGLKVDAFWASGLFGTIGSGGQVSNVVMKDCNITSNSGSAGGIAGSNEGTITACQVIEGTVTGANTGGIAGSNEGTITACQVIEGTVTCNGIGPAGGIAGSNSGTITACIAAPIGINRMSIGVLSGYNSNTITTSYWAKGVIPNDRPIGYGPAPTGGSSFAPDQVAPPGNFFTTGSPSSPIDLMNEALEAVGSDYRWAPGNEASGWYPVITGN